MLSMQLLIAQWARPIIIAKAAALIFKRCIHSVENVIGKANIESSPLFRGFCLSPN